MGSTRVRQRATIARVRIFVIVLHALLPVQLAGVGPSGDEAKSEWAIESLATCTGSAHVGTSEDLESAEAAQAL
ncbi:MAG: hypothetical protein HYR85_24985 [Planctomycetes bacterium]|nr:hypothetical protein [Planctomycetota bacterium]MBI3847257.1 hypothetical protein [Planctomycetota bacterium]